MIEARKPRVFNVQIYFSKHDALSNFSPSPI